MDFSEKWGTDVDTAVKLALADLKLTIDEVDVTVLEEPSRGFFGIGSKLALVRVEKKKAPVQEAPAPKQEKAEVKVEKAEKVEKVEKTEHRKEKPAKAHSERTEAPKNKKEKSNRKHNKKERTERSMENIAPVIEKVPDEKLTVCEDHVALKFLEEVTKEMGLTLDITAKTGEDSLYIDIQGKDSGTIIGKRGATLDAIQYLTSLVVNKDQNDYTRVVVDAENYRAKREKTLEMLALRLANKVSKSKKSVKLEPMNPYERKVIHATLQNHPHVTTRSEGQDPYRRVIIELK